MSLDEARLFRASIYLLCCGYVWNALMEVSSIKRRVGVFEGGDVCFSLILQEPELGLTSTCVSETVCIIKYTLTVVIFGQVQCFLARLH